jgi:hypothetical protein
MLRIRDLLTGSERVRGRGREEGTPTRKPSMSQAGRSLAQQMISVSGCAVQIQDCKCMEAVTCNKQNYNEQE